MSRGGVSQIMPNKIDIPFLPEFKESMLSGKKKATTRTKPYGQPGDWFPVFGKTFVLIWIYKTMLEIVAYHFYFEEGFDSRQEFIDCWDRLHPRIKYCDRPERTVYLHRFVQKDIHG
jgi:hypothetical protein